ncbi:hypothetical protein BAE44_0009682 [Dichanthelium oligosanthes]|uniref:Uncharacterized protein n=1 Tax=Dichanthelium oligosanthes TaxID=888268 RepID=A0A1E5VW02_9POAL|nr:hypothetical protein BAE44_0009682 [Dichanthelium oligosanthes]
MACALKRRNDDGEPSAAGVELTSGSGDNLLARTAKKKQLLPSAGIKDGEATGIDLTANLSDSVLVRVLELLPDALELVRTGALLRR